ncbi:MAG TPA: hypothetical protein VH277_04900 [Gemmatimonadaceae bacterium]|nr:hypothetical protein [Gemmatimonadaceae bacterium]
MIDIAHTGTDPVQYRIDPERRIVHVTLRGAVTFADLSAMQADILEDPSYCSEMAVYLDCRVVTAIPSHEQIRKLALDRLFRSASIPPAKLAMVAMTRLGFALASAIEAFLDAPKSQVRVFTSHVEARDWVSG